MFGTALVRSRRISVTAALLGRPEQRFHSTCAQFWLMTRSLWYKEARSSQAVATRSAIGAICPSIAPAWQLSESCPRGEVPPPYNHFKKPKPETFWPVSNSFVLKSLHKTILDKGVTKLFRFCVLAQFIFLGISDTKLGYETPMWVFVGTFISEFRIRTSFPPIQN